MKTTAAQVRATRLFKTLAKATRVEDHDNLIKMLLAANTHGQWWDDVDNVKWNENRLVHAFTWADTAYGQWWVEYSLILSEAGWDCY